MNTSASPACVCIALLALTLAAHAGAPDKLAIAAGPEPTEAQARQAVIAEMRRTLRDTADFGRVRFVSGPHLSSGINFADSREQAWLMCVINGSSRLSNRSVTPDLEVQPYLMRNRGGEWVIVSVAGWKESDIKC